MTKTPLAARPSFLVTVVVLALLLDQAVKLAVEAWLPFQERVDLVPMLALYRTWNEGIAFSFLSGLGAWGLAAVSLAVSAFVIYLWWHTDPHRWLSHLGFALIIGGAIGNLIDRVVYGHVIDYILFHTRTWSFAVFNLADSFITIGAGAVILDEVLHLRDGQADTGKKPDGNRRPD